MATSVISPTACTPIWKGRRYSLTARTTCWCSARPSDTTPVESDQSERPVASHGETSGGAGGLGQRGQRLLEALLRRLHESGADLTGAGDPPGHAGVDLRQPAGARHLQHVDPGRCAAETHDR